MFHYYGPDKVTMDDGEPFHKAVTFSTPQSCQDKLCNGDAFDEKAQYDVLFDDGTIWPGLSLEFKRYTRVDGEMGAAKYVPVTEVYVCMWVHFTHVRVRCTGVMLRKHARTEFEYGPLTSEQVAEFRSWAKENLV